MADKGKKGKAVAAPTPGPAAEPPPPPPAAEPEDKKDQDDEKKAKSVQPTDEVGTRKGCRRYGWELLNSNKEFWMMGHAEVKILSSVRWAGTPGQGPSRGKRVEEQAPEGLRKGSRVAASPLP